jgi:DNA-binding NarL/FixJ family response regulator
VSDVLAAARAAFARRDWTTARELFASVPEPLSADDLASLSKALWWLGWVDESLSTGDAAYQQFLRDGRSGEAGGCALDLAYTYSLRGAEELGAGWFGRAKRLLSADPDSVEAAFLRYVEVEAALEAEDLAPVIAAARALREDGVRHGYPDLVAVSTLAEGRALIRQGAVAAGLALVDEAMVDVVAGRLTPQSAGNLYCNAIATCHELVDLKRMWSWTTGLQQWCAEMPAAAVFAGICRVHRAQLLLVRGNLTAAEEEAARVCTELADLVLSTTAEVHYVLGDVHRLRGDLAGAERCYLDAHELGRDPQPGLALLRLAQGRPEVALNSIAAALTAASPGRLARVRLYAAQVEIALAAGEVEVARKAADELTETSDGSAGLRAISQQARGAVLLAEGQPDEALPALRQACMAWRELEAVYDCATVRLLLARAYEALGDVDAAARERSVAWQTLSSLEPEKPRPGGLSAREVEVLCLVAAGKSNREVAADLVLSEKTVARHLSNIFTKLDLTSRTAAAAYAYEHGLVVPVAG